MSENTGLVEVLGQREVATVADMTAHVARVRDIQKTVMVAGQHYGVIPGTGDKATLLKPGAEMLCLAFHIAPSYDIVDCGDSDCRRYRVTCIGEHQGTGRILGQGVGSASTNELKYRWRRTFNDKEWEATDESRRRLKYGYNRSTKQEFAERQIRTEPDDIDNTVLKMACKRALVAMVLAVTAASDVFAQDLDDQPEGLDADQQVAAAPRGKPRTQAPRARAPAGADAPTVVEGVVTAGQIRILNATISSIGIDESEFLAHFEIGAIEQLPVGKINEALGWLRAQETADPA